MWGSFFFRYFMRNVQNQRLCSSEQITSKVYHHRALMLADVTFWSKPQKEKEQPSRVDNQ